MSPSADLFSRPLPGLAAVLLAACLSAASPAQEAPPFQLEPVRLSQRRGLDPGASPLSSPIFQLQGAAWYENTVAGRQGVHAVLGSELDLSVQSEPAPSTRFLADLRVDSATGYAQLYESWLSARSPQGALGLRAGLLELSGLIGSSEAARDRKTQFLRTELVDNPALGGPPSAPGFLLWAQSPGRARLKLGAVNALRSSQEPFDNLFLAAELETAHQVGGLPGILRLWVREVGHGGAGLGPVPVTGALLDQRLTPGLIFFTRWARQYTARGLESDPTTGAYRAQPLNDGGASGQAAYYTFTGGLEWSRPLFSRPQDRLAAAWGTFRADDTSQWNFGEAYYLFQVTELLGASLHYGIDHSRLIVPVYWDHDGDGLAESRTYEALPDRHKIALRVTAGF